MEESASSSLYSKGIIGPRDARAHISLSVVLNRNLTKHETALGRRPTLIHVQIRTTYC